VISEMARKCPNCQRPLRKVSGRVVEREGIGFTQRTVVDMGPRFRCVNVACPHRVWVLHGNELLPLD
jgi:hypothetical protein